MHKKLLHWTTINVYDRTKQYIWLIFNFYLFIILGIVGEIADNHGFKFVGDDGRFRELNHVQHVSIYLMFVLHGVVDLCLHFGVPLPKVSKYLTAIAGFLWYVYMVEYAVLQHDAKV